MQFSYFQPDAAIGPLVSSYYSVTFAEPVSDIMRAEIANIRFVIDGRLQSWLGGIDREHARGDSLFCGPTHQASPVHFEAGARVFGAAITPLGWARMFDVSADELADLIVPLEDHIGPEHRPLVEQVFAAPDDATRALRCDHLFAALVDHRKRINHVFLEQMTAWITTPDDHELADLKAVLPMSSRQIERLSRRYFGASPRTVHRKFRALNSANRLTWQELDDWREVASMQYTDQSHFIREFKHFNGRTPVEFIKGAHLLVRMTLQERLKIVHGSPFSLIG